jgi:hypothetical protein
MGANMNDHITRQINSDAKKRRSFLAMLSVAGDLRRYVCFQYKADVEMQQKGADLFS